LNSIIIEVQVLKMVLQVNYWS